MEMDSIDQNKYLTRSYSVDEYGLIFSGGGAKGSYEIGVWKAIKELGLVDSIAGVSGASVGALNALLFGLKDIENAQTIWREYATKSMFLDLQLMDGACSRDALISIINMLDIERIKESGIPVYISTYNKKYKKTEYHNLCQKNKEEMIKILLASSALPIVYKSIKLGHDAHIDGGIMANTPVEPLYKSGLRKFIVVYLNQDCAGINFDHYKDAKFIKVYPSVDLGSLISGTLDFDLESIESRMKLGQYDGNRLLSGFVNDGKDSVDKLCKDVFKTAGDLEKFCSLDVGNVNMKFPTLIGKIWWEDVFQLEGWHIQRNSMFNNCRILDKRNYRRAWFSSEGDLKKALYNYKVNIS